MDKKSSISKRSSMTRKATTMKRVSSKKRSSKALIAKKKSLKIKPQDMSRNGASCSTASCQVILTPMKITGVEPTIEQVNEKTAEFAASTENQLQDTGVAANFSPKEPSPFVPSESEYHPSGGSVTSKGFSYDRPSLAMKRYVARSRLQQTVVRHLNFDEPSDPAEPVSKYHLSDDDSDSENSVESRQYISADNETQEHHVSMVGTSTDFRSSPLTPELEHSSASQPNVLENLLETADRFESAELCSSEAQTLRPGTSKTQPTSFISIKNGEAALSVTEVLHKGRYRFHMFIVGDSQNGFIEHVQQEDTHLCETPSGGIVALLTRIRDSVTINCQVNICIPAKSKLYGSETFSEHANLFLTPLSAGLAAGYNQANGSSPLFAPLHVEDFKAPPNYCFFCKKMKSQITRHFVLVHKDKPEVESILLLPKGSRERTEALSNLRVKSNSIYNSKCDPSNRLPVRRPNKKEDVSKYVECPNCQKYYAPKTFYKHERKCTDRSTNRQHVLRAAKASMKMKEASKKHGTERIDVFLEKFLTEFDDSDDKTYIIKNDQCLRWYARDKAFQNRNVTHHYPYHRTQLRRGAVILLKAQSLNPDIKCFGDLLLAKNQNLLVESIILACGIDEKTGDIRTPTVIPHFKAFIQHCVEAENRIRLENGEKLSSDRIQELKAFIMLHNMNFKAQLGTESRRANVRKLALKVKQLPSNGDVCKFTLYLRSIADECYRFLTEHLDDGKFSYDKWLLLGKAVQCQWVLFNRRRSGEMSRVLLSQYQTHAAIDPSFTQGLDEEQQRFCQHFRRFMLVAKKLRVLPVLTTEMQIKHLDLFISLRERAGISAKNPYLFCAQTKTGWIHCGYALRSLAYKSGVSQPYLMGTTNVRKQVATLAQHLKMDYNEMVQLADFMGHDLKVHQQNYRQHEAVMQATKIAKFLVASQSEDMTQYRSKNIDDIEVDLDSGQIVLDDYLAGDDEEHQTTSVADIPPDMINESTQENQSADEPISDRITSLPPKESISEPSTSWSDQLPGSTRPQRLKKMAQKRRKYESTQENQSADEPISGRITSVPPKESISEPSTSWRDQLPGSTTPKCLKKMAQKRTYPTTPELLLKLATQGRKLRKVRAQYTNQEKQFLYEHMKSYLDERKLPPMSFCKHLARTYPKEVGYRSEQCLYSFAQYRLKLSFDD